MSLADPVTINISNCIEEMGIKISAISRATGIAEGILRRSVSKRERSLRAEEAMAICNFLKRDPFDFYNSSTTK